MLLVTLAKKLLFSKEIKNLRASVILIATFGILFATAAVLVSLGVLSGYQRMYRDAVLGFSAHLIVFRDDGLTQEEQTELAQFLESLSIPNEFSPYHFYEALAPGKKGFEPLIFKGIDPAKRSAVYPMSFQSLPKGTANGVFVGKDVPAAQPEIKKTGYLKYLILRGEAGSSRTRYERLAVQGTFESGYFDFDSRFVLLPLKLLQTRFLKNPVVSGFEIRLKDPDAVLAVKDAISRRFLRQFDILTWQELNQSLFEALKLDRTVVFSVSFLILLIACLNIFGFNFLFFMERKREFLILSALGMGLGRLRRLLALLSLILGGLSALIGTGIGLILLKYLADGPGIALDPEVYFVDRVPVYFETSWFMLFLAGVVALCLATSWLAGRVVVKRFMTANLKV